MEANLFHMDAPEAVYPLARRSARECGFHRWCRLLIVEFRQRF